jgi:Tfp pilus assembly protein PilF
MKAGDTKQAIENYKKSLALNPNNGNAKKYLAELEKK